MCEQHSRSIALRTQGGFCNRVRAIVSGVLWAEDLGRKLVIYWPDEPGHLPCKLEDLLVSKSIPRLCCVHAGYLPGARSVQSLKDMDAVLAVVGDTEDIKIESYSAFHPDCYGDRGISILRSLRIQPVIADLADKLWNDSGCDSKMIGIHYRGTDHRKCLEASPLKLFVERMSEWLDEVPGARFLLCTDEHGVARTMKDLFGDRVVVAVDVRGRRVPEQQVLGVVDWLLLHRCPMVWGSAGSSFSELATIRSGGTLLKVCVTPRQ